MLDSLGLHLGNRSQGIQVWSAVLEEQERRSRIRHTTPWIYLSELNGGLVMTGTMNKQ